MKDGINDDTVVARFVENLEGKSANQGAPELIDRNAIQQRMSLEAFHAGFDAAQELFSEPRLLITRTICRTRRYRHPLQA